MAVKILINALGQHIIADASAVSNKETNELLAYWVKQPRVLSYRGTEDGKVSVDFIDYCPVGSSLEFAIAAHHVVSLLDPKEEVEVRYLEIVTPAPDEVVVSETEVVDEDLEGVQLQ